MFNSWGGLNNNAANSFYGIRVLNGIHSWYATDANDNVLIKETNRAKTILTELNKGVDQKGTIINVDTGEEFEFARFSNQPSTWAFSNEDLILFGGYSTRRAPVARCYSLKLYVKGRLVRDFIPCLDTEGTPCMFDKVSGKTFYNDGEDEFIYGDIIVGGGKLSRVEYLYSYNRNNYINTELRWNETVEYEIKLSIEPNAGIVSCYGQYDAWVSYLYNLPNISTYTSYRLAQNFKAGFSSANGVDLGIAEGQTGVVSLKGNNISWSEGTSSEFDRGTTSFTTTGTIALFSQSGGKEYAKTKIYYAKFWLNDKLVRNFIPCIDSDGVACLYDTVTKKAYYDNNGNEFYTNLDVDEDGNVTTASLFSLREPEVDYNYSRFTDEEII